MTTTHRSFEVHPYRSRRSASLSIGVTALLASAVLTGCTPEGEVIDADYAQVCQDRTTQERVEDSKCSEEGRSSGTFGWYFFAMGALNSGQGRSIPAVGARLANGVTSIPAGASAKSGVTAQGSPSVSRNGFGSSVKSGGGVGS
ncbi:hypothetical protein [Arthrobacter sp. Br18]|uniref:hypothetical protein n=1 Tax=Arthrobacter sp. Br18 TaxID=1312954 RepID=UPI0004B0DCFD|nr:hypothetical protein [Arthrobacter sp. Br18]